MKTTPFYAAFFLILMGCNNAEVISISEHDQEIMRHLSQYFDGRVHVKNGIRTVADSGADSEGYYRISLECEDLKSYYTSASVPASYCAWYCYSHLSETERNFFKTYTVQVPFDNQQKSVEYSAGELGMVLQAQPQLDSVSAYFVSGDYPTMQAKFIPEIQQDNRLSTFQKQLENMDVKYGKTKETKIRGFQILEMMKDSISENREYLVQFQLLQVRDSINLQLSATVSTHTLYGFIAGINFE